MNRASLLFCIAAVAASLVLFVVGFHLAALPTAALAASRKPVPAMQYPDIQLGGGFGSVSAIDLLGYYLEHPPVSGAENARSRDDESAHFGGC